MSIKVLIVEDEFVVANALRLVLKEAGYSVNGIAPSAEEAETHLHIQKPDIVLLDIRLNGNQSGIDLARLLKAENIAFIYLSAHSSQQILEEAKKTEPYGFLVKPFREKDLLVALDIALYRHQNTIEYLLSQEELLSKQLLAIACEMLDVKSTLLKIAHVMQPFIPFDLLSAALGRPNGPGNVNFGYLRTGFDEYEFIGEKEFINITDSQTGTLLPNSEINNTYTGTVVCNNEISSSRSQLTLEHQQFQGWFKIGSYLTLPVILRNGQTVQYSFYSRQRNAYNQAQNKLLERLITRLTEIAKNMVDSANRFYRPIAASDLSQRRSAEKIKHPEFANIIGNHPLLLATLDLTAQVAPYNTSVLILGETGTGKEIVAQCIHSLSMRRNRPFIKVNCAAIPANLIESELFGHEKGAFTGAIEKRKGKFELAEGGTIFLDEIGELPLDLQVKLLRVLQEKEIDYVGGNISKKINVRIIAATNRNLEKEVAEGNFRLDLYYRLNIFPITLPPLRERKSDIPILASYFAKKLCQQFNKGFSGIASSMITEMTDYRWPGNIRELENIIEQCVVLHDGISELKLQRDLTLKPAKVSSAGHIETLEDVKNIQRQTEREYIISFLRKTGGRIRGINGAAVLLNIKPTTLEAKMIKLNIDRKDL